MGMGETASAGLEERARYGNDEDGLRTVAKSIHNVSQHVRVFNRQF
jgi:hypothetical protein